MALPSVMTDKRNAKDDKDRDREFESDNWLSKDNERAVSRIDGVSTA